MQTLYALKLQSVDFDRILAVPMAGLPIGAAVSLALGKPLIFNRKVQKRHGLQKVIEGCYRPGDKVVIVDDLITTGKSVLEAAETAEAEGLKVSAIVVLIGRYDFDGVENLIKRGYRVEHVYRWRDNAFN